MTNPRLSFGQPTTYGELARGADELSVEMSLALGEPQPGAVHMPPFAVLPALLDGCQIGAITKYVFVNDATCYCFASTSGNTKFSCATTDEVLHELEQLLGLRQSTHG